MSRQERYAMKFRIFGSPFIITRDRREYPIKRDEHGLSARKRAFAAFDEGRKPEEFCNSIDISLRTAARYHADWKKLPPKFAKNYELQKKTKRSGHPLFNDDAIKMIAGQLSIPEEEVAHYLETPWGLQKILKGEFIPDQERKIQWDEATRKVVLLKVVTAMEMSALPPKDILLLADRLLKEAKGQGGPSNLARRVVYKMFGANRRRKNHSKR